MDNGAGIHPAFSEGSEPLSGFVEYLAKKSKVKVSLECHNLTRSDKEGYKVSNTERVGFNLKDIYTMALCSDRPRPSYSAPTSFHGLWKGQTHKFCTMHHSIPRAGPTS